MELVKLKARIVNHGYGYEIIDSTRVQMRVAGKFIKPGDVVVSVDCQFGNITSMVVIREIKNCDFEIVDVVCD